MGKKKRSPERPYQYAGMDWYEDQIIHLKKLGKQIGTGWSELARLAVDEQFKLNQSVDMKNTTIEELQSLDDEQKAMIATVQDRRANGGTISLYLSPGYINTNTDSNTVHGLTVASVISELSDYVREEE